MKCDFCNNYPAQPFTFWLDRKMEDDQETDEILDLCQDHINDALEILFGNPSCPKQRKFLKQLQKARRKKIYETRHGRL